ncbi:DUF805 domain-containing protein [Vibrio coralliirubri]|uniref:DUF805 domain-containing protein n=1 Tax=Vibrio coralliirubri TaxID=1516159 RepID=UPI000EFCD8CB
MKLYCKALSNTLTTSGRSTRTDIVSFMIPHIIICLYLIYGYLIGVTSNAVLSLYICLSTLTLISLFIRRIHDTGHSGWLIFMLLIPGMGMALLIFFLSKKGQPYHNRYGYNPRSET